MQVIRRKEPCRYKHPTGSRFTLGGYVGSANLPREEQGCLRLNALQNQFWGER